MKDLAQLLSTRQLTRATNIRYVRHCIPTGVSTLDDFLPGRGFQRGGVTELIGNGEVYSLALAAMTANSATSRCAYLSGAGLLNPLTIRERGGELSRCYFSVHSKPREMFWTAQQILGSGLVQLLIIDASHWQRGYPLVDAVAYRRLMGLSDRQGAVVLLLLQPHPRLAVIGRPCLLRLKIEEGTVTVLKCAGGAPGGQVELAAAVAA